MTLSESVRAQGGRAAAGLPLWPRRAAHLSLDEPEPTLLLLPPLAPPNMPSAAVRFACRSLSAFGGGMSSELLLLSLGPALLHLWGLLPWLPPRPRG